jgi:hypothetical protein
VGDLAEAMRACGATGIVTDDLGVYREAARRQYWERAVCWYHWRRWVGRALRALEGAVPRTTVGGELDWSCTGSGALGAGVEVGGGVVVRGGVDGGGAEEWELGIKRGGGP